MYAASAIGTSHGGSEITVKPTGPHPYHLSATNNIHAIFWKSRGCEREKEAEDKE